MTSQEQHHQLEDPYKFDRRDSSQMRNDANYSQDLQQGSTTNDDTHQSTMYQQSANSTLSSAPSVDSDNGAWNQHPYNASAPAEAEAFSFARKPEDDTKFTNWNGVTPLEVETPQPQSHSISYDDNDSNDDNSSSKKSRRQRRKEKAKQTMQHVGSSLWKNLNVAKWIDDLEHDQELADYLEHLNIENQAELERQEICRQALEACLQDIRQHLLEFLQVHPQATYEEWIAELHPDNVTTSLQGLTGAPMIDHRFYVASSDHRILWNEHLGDQNDTSTTAPIRHYVPARAALPQSSASQQKEESNTNNNMQQSTSGGDEVDADQNISPVLLDLSNDGIAASDGSQEVLQQPTTEKVVTSDKDNAPVLLDLSDHGTAADTCGALLDLLS